MMLFMFAGGAHAQDTSPYTLVLGVAQDGGAPQAGAGVHAGGEGFRRHVASLAIVDPRDGKRWLIDCTPDFPLQLGMLDKEAPRRGDRVLDGVFLTHAHMGHYTGLMHLGHEVMGAKGIPVYAMPRMKSYLEGNGPWDQLVRYENITLSELQVGQAIELASGLSVEAFTVPHRQEYSEVVGFVVRGPSRSVLYIPDIDSWHEWDEQGTRIEEWLHRVDVAYLDGTFYDNGEIPGRDMSGFPHPFIAHSMERFADLDDATKQKVRFHSLESYEPGAAPRQQGESNRARQRIRFGRRVGAC